MLIVLDELFGETKKSQQERVKERLARRKQLVAERKAQGLSTDEETINTMVEEEEIQEQKNRRRVGLTLSYMQTLSRDFATDDF